MRSLNYHHLLYFWTVARTGSIAAASRELFLSPPAISTQLKSLEAAVGTPLLKRTSRGFELTSVGQLVFEHADEIFRIGTELSRALETRVKGRRLRVGLGQMIPKLLARELLRPVFEDGPTEVVVECREAWNETLMDALLAHEIDVVIADAPAVLRSHASLQQQVVGETEIGFFATGALSARLAAGFPSSLDGAPLLLPTASSGLRHALGAWLDRKGVGPRVAAECDDGGLLITFAQQELGAFAAPLQLASELAGREGLTLIGAADGLSVPLYALSTRRKLLNPAVRALFAERRAGALGPDPVRSAEAG